MAGTEIRLKCGSRRTIRKLLFTSVAVVVCCCFFSGQQHVADEHVVPRPTQTPKLGRRLLASKLGEPEDENETLADKSPYHRILSALPIHLGAAVSVAEGVHHFSSKNADDGGEVKFRLNGSVQTVSPTENGNVLAPKDESHHPLSPTDDVKTTEPTAGEAADDRGFSDETDDGASVSGFERAEPTSASPSSSVPRSKSPHLPTPSLKNTEEEDEEEESDTNTTTEEEEESATSKQFEKCTPPAYHEFPPDLFTERQRRRGAILIHIGVIVYMFYAVAVVCDDYFIASLEECCNRLQLSEDVAGATFMAAGSSAPELFTAILGVLVAKGDVGTGTIVGSAVFNVLFVIGVCGIFSGRVVQLTWWPLFRDSSFYSLTVIILIVIIFDSEVTWYESVIMMVVYSIYIVIMKYSNELHFWTARRLGIEAEDTSSACLGILAEGDKKNYSSYVPFNNEIDAGVVSARFHQRPPADESIRDARNTVRLSLYDAALQVMMKRDFRPKSRFRAAVFRVMLEHERRKKEDEEWSSAGNRKIQPQLSIDSVDITKWKAKSFGAGMGLTSGAGDWKRLPTRENGCLGIVKWILQAPLMCIMYYTIPDCRKDRWRKFFLLTFLMSITWTAVFSYIMVWMVTLVGFTFGIPDSIMGITFLAAGTSVPDAFASLIVARQGQGDMAVSNSIGSNVFDILIGLAFPWFIQTALVEPGSIATINSRGMVYSVALLFLTILITIGGIWLSHWQLTHRLGIVLLSVYAVFLAISILLEFNLLGYVNPPMCPE